MNCFETPYAGHLFRMCIECKSLSEIPPPKPSPENVESLDPQLAITLEDTAIGEVKLCRLPLLTIISRLDLLLDEWPEHPILSQLKEIADRTLNFSVNVPLRKVLIGLELLIGRAQVWISFGLINTKKDCPLLYVDLYINSMIFC